MSNKDATPPDRFNESPPLSAYDYFSSPGKDTTDTGNDTGNAYGIKIDSRTDSAILLHFHEVKAETAKAICLAVTDYTTGQVMDDWFPKKLCSNMNTVKNCVHVWDVFMKEHKADLIPPELREEE